MKTPSLQERILEAVPDSPDEILLNTLVEKLMPEFLPQDIRKCVDEMIADGSLRGRYREISTLKGRFRKLIAVKK